MYTIKFMHNKENSRRNFLIPIIYVHNAQKNFVKIEDYARDSCYFHIVGESWDAIESLLYNTKKYKCIMRKRLTKWKKKKKYLHINNSLILLSLRIIRTNAGKKTWRFLT